MNVKFKYVIIYKNPLLLSIDFLHWKYEEKTVNTVQLECFLAVVEYMNFSKAADALKITQPAVSHQITSLEDELGARLFIRTSKHVSLTEAGLMFIEDASGILKIASRAKDKLGAGVNDFMPFMVGCHNISELNLLPPVIRKLMKHFPTLRPSVKLIPFKSMAALLEDERIHVMFGFQNDDQKRPLGIFHSLGQLPVSCVCPPDHPLAERTSIDMEELHGPMVLCEPQRLPPLIFQSQVRISSACPPSELYFAESYESVLALVKAGLGYTLLPAYPGCEQKGLCYIPVTGLEPVEFGLYYKSLKGNPVLKEFIRLMDTEWEF